MKVKFALLLLVMVLVSGCSGFNLFDESKAFLARDSDSLGVAYTTRLAVGQYEGERFYIKGVGANNFAFYLTDIADKISVSKINVTSRYPNHRGIRLHVWNYSSSPVQVDASRFFLVDPTGNKYTYDWNLQWDMAIYNSNEEAITSSITLQPNEQRNIIIYFRTGNIDIHSTIWRLGYNMPSGFLGIGNAPIYVWAHIAYEKE